MARKTYVVTVGLRVGLFSTWLLAGPQVNDAPPGSKPLHQSFDTRAEAQAAYNQALNEGLVWIIDPVTGGRTQVHPQHASQLGSPIRAPGGQMSSHSSPAQSMSSPASVSHRNRQQIEQESLHHSTQRTMRDHAPGRAAHSHHIETSPNGDRSLSTTSSPPTGVTQRERSLYSSDVLERSSSVQTPIFQPGLPTNHSFQVQHSEERSRNRRCRLESEEDGVFSSPQTNATTHDGPPNRRSTEDRPINDLAGHTARMKPPATPLAKAIATKSIQTDRCSSPKNKARSSEDRIISAVRAKRPSPALSSERLSEERLLKQLVGSNVDITPRRGAHRRFEFNSQPPTVQPREEPEPQNHPLQARSKEIRASRQSGTSSVSESEMEEYYDISSSSDEESSDGFESLDASSSNSSVTWRTAASISASSSRSMADRQEVTVDYAHGAERVLRGSAIDYISRRATSSSTPRSRPHASASALGRTRRLTPPTNDSISSPLALNQLPFSPGHRRAEVHSPNVDPRSPIPHGSMWVPTFENDNAHFGRPTPPQSLAALIL